MFNLPSISDVVKKGPAMLGVLKESLGAVWKSDKGFLDKIGVFISTFQEEWKKLDKEESDVKDGTKEKVDEKIAEKLKPAKEAVNLDESNLSAPDKEFYEEILAVGDVSMQTVAKKHPAGVESGLNKISGAVKDGKSDSFNYDELSAMGSTVSDTIRQLKKDPRYNTAEKFKAMLDKLDKVSANTDYPLSKLRKFTILGLFKMTNQDEAVKLLEKFGLKASMGDVAGKATEAVSAFLPDGAVKALQYVSGAEGGTLTHVKNTFAGLKESPPQNLEEMVKIAKEHFMKNTSPLNITKLFKIVNKLILSSEKELTNSQLSEMVFLVDNDDLKNFVTVLTGE